MVFIATYFRRFYRVAGARLSTITTLQVELMPLLNGLYHRTLVGTAQFQKDKDVYQRFKERRAASKALFSQDLCGEPVSTSSDRALERVRSFERT
jgi:hypothetical protein